MKFQMRRGFYATAVLGLLMVCSFLIQEKSGRADVPSLSNLSFTNIEDTFKTFGALMNFRPLEPASSFGKTFGFALGVEAQLTPSKKLKGFIPNSDSFPAWLPDAYIVGVIQAPLGLSLELGVMPARKIKDFHLEQYAANVKWTLSDVIFGDEAPVDIAVRAGFATGKILYSQNISGVPVVIDYSQRLLNFNAMVSKRLLFLEPYFGVGMVNQAANISASAAGTFTLVAQGQTISGPASYANAVDDYRNSAHVFGGLQIHIFAFNLTVEDSYQFGLNSLALKLGGKF